MAARKITPAMKTPATKSLAPKTAAKAAPVVTEVRNSPIPKVVPAVKKEIAFDAIAKRAFEIHMGGTGGSESDNWFRAERELRGGL